MTVPIEIARFSPRYSDLDGTQGNMYALTCRTSKFAVRGGATPNSVPFIVTCAAEGALPNEAEVHPSCWVVVTCVIYFLSIGKVSLRRSSVLPIKDRGRTWTKDTWKKPKCYKLHENVDILI